MTDAVPTDVPTDVPHPPTSELTADPAALPSPGGAVAATTDAVELLGLVAQLEHTAFVRLAADSALAPDVTQRLALSRFAAAAVERRDRVLARIEELGGDAAAALQPFEAALTDFDERTQPSSWWERLLKAYVGYGVADDFCRLAARGLDDRSRDVVLEVLEDASHAELAVAELDAAGSSDTVLASRLALWGRRLVGEALGTVQRLLTQRPALERLVRAGAAAPADERVAPDGVAPDGEAGNAAATGGAPAANAPAKLFSELTAEHTRRMGRLGLTA